MRDYPFKGILVMFVVGALLLCGGTQTLAEEKIKVPHMNFSTGSVGALWYPMGSTIVDLCNKKYFEGYPITAIPGAGGVGNPKRVGIGAAEVKFGFSYGPFLKKAVAGEAPYDKPYPMLKSICSLLTSPQQLLVTKSLNITTFGEIKNRKVPLKIGSGPPGSSEEFTLRAIFTEMGISLDDIKKWGGKVERVGTSGRIDLWKDRHINAWTGVTPAPSGHVDQVLMIRSGNLVGLEKSLREAMITKWGYMDYIIPAGTYKGQDKPVETIAMAIVFFGREEVPEEVVYYLTKTVAENKAALLKVNAGFKKWEPEMMTRGLGIDIHPGALRYYKERGWL